MAGINFLEELNKKTNNKYYYIRIEDWIIDEDACSLEITFVVPYESADTFFLDKDKEVIAEVCREIVPKNVNLKIHFNRLLLNEDIIVRYINLFITNKYNKIFLGRYSKKDIIVKIDAKDVYVELKIDQLIKSFCESNKIQDELKNYLDLKIFAEKITVVFKYIEMPKSEKQIVSKKDTFVIDSKIIETQYVRGLVGSDIGTNALCISSYTKPTAHATICGVINKIEKKTYNRATATGSIKQKVYYVIQLEDPEGKTMKCLYFTRATKHCALNNLKENTQIKVYGELKKSDRSSYIDMIASDINEVIINYEKFKEVKDYIQLMKIKKNLPKPEAFKVNNDKKLVNIFDENVYIADILRDNTFVVIDVETTGIARATDKIIEIAGYKIVEGEIVEKFVTLVDPEIPIPETATNVNHITDAMVATAPFMEDVIDIFLSFANDTIIVGQGVDFDITFLSRAAETYGYKFNYNKVFDTQKLAKTDDPKDYKTNLAHLCEKYNVKLTNPHRAGNDALATAELFILLANKLKLTN